MKFKINRIGESDELINRIQINENLNLNDQNIKVEKQKT